ncbi:hypothetical protein L5515_009669 [Caenorhabditis briggsae]|uniref:Uncharacterized protein n=1 Tax=Caenorhabditis briggsae TaxID=6238 RepID=A0AAE9F9F8_CAEBR|nr:hypothetical protein L5515_009669 [Caenorhabditis briggsae]
MTRRVLLLSAASVLMAAAGYAPEPSYYNKYGGYHKALDKKHGGYEADQTGYGGHNGMSDYGSDQGAYGHYDGKYGESGKKSGSEYYAKGDEHGHGDEAHEKGLKKNGDAYGGKKFSYFTSGSGPYGSYQKGYYGSDGYEHDDHKSKYSSHNEDNGFKKGYDGAGAGHDDKYTSYDKEDGAHKKHHEKYDIGKYGAKQSGYANHGHNEGWQNQAQNNKYGSRESGSEYGHPYY